MRDNLVPFVPGIRVAVTPYFRGETNRCPSCHGQQWHVGRITAECARPGCGHVAYIFRPGEQVEFAA